MSSKSETRTVRYGIADTFVEDNSFHQNILKEHENLDNVIEI